MRYISCDCNTDNKSVHIFFDLLHCCEKVHGNKEFSCGDSKTCCESRIMTH